MYLLGRIIFGKDMPNRETQILDLIDRFLQGERPMWAEFADGTLQEVVNKLTILANLGEHRRNDLDDEIESLERKVDDLRSDNADLYRQNSKLTEKISAVRRALD